MWHDTVTVTKSRKYGWIPTYKTRLLLTKQQVSFATHRYYSFDDFRYNYEQFFLRNIQESIRYHRRKVYAITKRFHLWNNYIHPCAHHECCRLSNILPYNYRNGGFIEDSIQTMYATYSHIDCIHSSCFYIYFPCLISDVASVENNLASVVAEGKQQI